MELFLTEGPSAGTTGEGDAVPTHLHHRRRRRPCPTAGSGPRWLSRRWPGPAGGRTWSSTTTTARASPSRSCRWPGTPTGGRPTTGWWRRSRRDRPPSSTWRAGAGPSPASSRRRGSSASTSRPGSWPRPGRCRRPRLLVRARATAMPVADGAADAVVSSMALMLLAPLDAVLGEVRRVLRAGGTFAATVPVRSVGAGSVFAEILDALGQSATGYPCDLDPGTSAGRLAAAGLTLEADDTGLFTRTIGDGDDAGVVVRSFYAPGADDARVAAAVAGLERRVRSGARPARLPHPAAGRRRPRLTGPGYGGGRDGSGRGWGTGRGRHHRDRRRHPPGRRGRHLVPAAGRRLGAGGGTGGVAAGRLRGRGPRPGGSGPRTTSTASWPGAWAGSASSRWRPRSWPWPTPASPATPATGWAWWSTPAPAG